MSKFFYYQILANRFILNLKKWKNSRCHFSFWYSIIGHEVIGFCQAPWSVSPSEYYLWYGSMAPRAEYQIPMAKDTGSLFNYLVVDFFRFHLEKSLMPILPLIVNFGCFVKNSISSTHTTWHFKFIIYISQLILTIWNICFVLHDVNETLTFLLTQTTWPFKYIFDKFS